MSKAFRALSSKLIAIGEWANGSAKPGLCRSVVLHLTCKPPLNIFGHQLRDLNSLTRGDAVARLRIIWKYCSEPFHQASAQRIENSEARRVPRITVFTIASGNCGSAKHILHQ
jgi:hypothetical protein